VYCLQPPELAGALCSCHFDEVAQRAQIECVEITESVAGCLNLPKEGCSLVHHFMKKEDVLKTEQHQSITITHSKVKVLRNILDGIFMKT
jgi:hypothetical protein